MRWEVGAPRVEGGGRGRRWRGNPGPGDRGRIDPCAGTGLRPGIPPRSACAETARGWGPRPASAGLASSSAQPRSRDPPPALEAPPQRDSAPRRRPKPHVGRAGLGGRSSARAPWARSQGRAPSAPVWSDRRICHGAAAVASALHAAAGPRPTPLRVLLRAGGEWGRGPRRLQPLVSGAREVRCGSSAGRPRLTAPSAQCHRRRGALEHQLLAGQPGGPRA